MGPPVKYRQFWGYVLVAVAGVLVGMALGQLNCSRVPGGSRIDWTSK